MAKKIVYDQDGLEVYSYHQLSDGALKFAYKVFGNDRKTSLLRHPTGFDSQEEAMTDMYAYLQSLENILSDADGVVIYSYVTTSGETKYGNRVYDSAEKKYLARESAGFDTQKEADMDAQAYIYEMEGEKDDAQK